MIATSAKLAELLEAASPGSWSVLDVWTTGGDIMVHADRKSVAVVAEENAMPNAKLIAAAPALARLVLTLGDALSDLTVRVDSAISVQAQRSLLMLATDKARAALADAEALRL